MLAAAAPALIPVPPVPPPPFRPPPPTATGPRGSPTLFFYKEEYEFK